MENLGRTLDISSGYYVSLLVASLEANKAAHIEDYKKAVEVYNRDVQTKLKLIAKMARKTITNPEMQKNLIKVYGDYCRLSMPVNASKTYDTYISLMSQTSSDTVVLSIQDANAIINDEWDWAIAAKNTNSSYSSRF